MMNKKKLIIVATIAGLLGTTAAVEASGFMKKVNGFLRGDIDVTVDGKATSLEPVFINGQAYLPARSEAEALGYELHYNARNKVLEITSKDKPEEGESNLINVSGIIEDVRPTKDGSVQISVLGRGQNNWIVLTVDKETVLTNQEGKSFAAKDLKAGLELTAEYGPIVAMSYPGQSHAVKVVVGSERLVKTDVIQSVEKTSDGWQVKFGDGKETTLVLNSGKETTIRDTERQPIEWSALKAGMKVTTYYGPATTKSIPPISALHFLVVAEQSAALSPAQVTEYRELAWKQLSDDQKKHVVTKKDEAEVTIVPASDAALFPQDDKKKAYEDYVAKKGNVVLVTYKTDDDQLLGPLTLGFSSDTKEYFGNRIRR